MSGKRNWRLCAVVDRMESDIVTIKLLCDRLSINSNINKRAVLDKTVKVYSEALNNVEARTSCVRVWIVRITTRYRIGAMALPVKNAIWAPMEIDACNLLAILSGVEGVKCSLFDAFFWKRKFWLNAKKAIPRTDGPPMVGLVSMVVQFIDMISTGSKGNVETNWWADNEKVKITLLGDKCFGESINSQHLGEKSNRTELGAKVMPFCSHLCRFQATNMPTPCNLSPLYSIQFNCLSQNAQKTVSGGLHVWSVIRIGVITLIGYNFWLFSSPPQHLPFIMYFIYLICLFVVYQF